MTTERPRWSERTKLVVSLLLLALGVYLLARFSAVIPAFVLALVVAYVISPLVNRLERSLRLPRGLATALAYVLVVAVLVTGMGLLVNPLARQVAVFNLDIQQIFAQVEHLIGRQYTVGTTVIDGMALVRQVEGTLQGLVEPLVGQTVTVLVDVITSLVWLVFIVVVSFYLVKDAAAVNAWLEGIIPPTYRPDFIRLREQINAIWAAFFRGQLLLALVVALLITAVGFLIGLPFALVMGLLAGLLEFLPSLGHGIWLTVASILAFFLGSTWLPLPNWAFLLLVIGLHVVFQQFDLNYLIPRIIGRSVHLPPLVVILGIVAGASLAGVLGIALAAPTIASARVLLRYVYANLFDLEPFPPEEAAPPLPPPTLRWWQRRPAPAEGEADDDS